MAKGQYLTSHQRGIVHRYYANLDTLTLQKLQETVSDLYLASGEKAAARLWASARTALERSGIDRAKVDGVINARDVKGLAELVARIGATR